LSLEPGRSLGHYQIVARLGAGGMGEVWRATDTRLSRDVAIKVLPKDVASDPDRLARFRREAQLLAALNHPSVAAIHGIEEAEGQPFLVLELVPGEDLSQRLKQGPIPLDEALPIARQIAEALEEAHERGIVHRDLKPANVKVTPDGKVKVLDFGLAKAWGGEPGAGSAPDLSASPTLAHTGTEAGVILGTAAYMSPEQARGKPVDRRSDIWAFGALVHEMLTAGSSSRARPSPTCSPPCSRASPTGALCPQQRRRRCECCFAVAWSATQSRGCATSARHASRCKRPAGPSRRHEQRRRRPCASWRCSRRLPQRSRSRQATRHAGQRPLRSRSWAARRSCDSSPSSLAWSRSPPSRPTATTSPTRPTSEARST